MVCQNFYFTKQCHMYISLPVDYHDQLPSLPSSPHDESQQQHSDHVNNNNAELAVKPKPVINMEQESHNIAVVQEESQSEMMELKEEALPCSSLVGCATGKHVCVHYAVWEPLKNDKN